MPVADGDPISALAGNLSNHELALYAVLCLAKLRSQSMPATDGDTISALAGNLSYQELTL